MTTYQPYVDFTAHGTSVRALMLLYAQLEKRKHTTADLLPIVVFMAFAIEAYLNSLGSRAIPFWDQIERTPWKQKVEILHRQAGKTANWGQKPLQFAGDIFKLRDKLAHGKPEQLLGPRFDDLETAGVLLNTPVLEPEWFKQITEEWARVAKLDFTALMIYLGALYGHHESDHLLSSSGGIFRHE